MRRAVSLPQLSYLSYKLIKNCLSVYVSVLRRMAHIVTAAHRDL